MPTAPGPTEIVLKRGSRRFRISWGFKTVALNLAGWSAVVAAGLALGGVLVLATSLKPWTALSIGVLSVWLLLVALDHRRWRNGMTHLCRGNMDAAKGAAIVARLQEMGIVATYREETFGERDEHVQRGIVCRNADADDGAKDDGRRAGLEGPRSPWVGGPSERAAMWNGELGNYTLCVLHVGPLPWWLEF